MSTASRGPGAPCARDLALSVGRGLDLAMQDLTPGCRAAGGEGCRDRFARIPEPIFTETLQIAIVVRDLDAAVRTYFDEYGIGPWEIYEFNPSTVEQMTKDDRPAEYAMRIALAKVGSVEWELIEPLDDKSIYAEFLASHGGGLHHLGLGVRDHDEALATLRGKGHSVIQGGIYNGVTFSYISTERDLGVVTEIFDWPEGHEQVPDATYPPA